MTNQDFSLGFDLLWNNLMSNQAPGLNEYEKSLLLTKAQDEILKNYFNPGGNKYGQGFDMSRKREIDFSKLIEVDSGDATLVASGNGVSSITSFSYKLPDRLFFILNETVEVKKDGSSAAKALIVIPISYTEYQRLMCKTFKAPYKWQCWRLMNKAETDSSTVELIPGYDYTSCKYTIKYVRYPKPIILGDLPDGLMIDGISTETECELSEEIHQEILQRAVEIAKVTWLGDASSVVEIGKRSE